MRKLKMNKIKIVVSIAFLLGCVLVNASDIYTPVFYGNVTVSNWPGITNTAITTTSGGTMTNGVYTNTYRLYMTNIFGRTTRSTNLTSTFTGDVTYTNAVQLTWGRYYKYATHVIIEKSWDAGVNWTNWIAIAGTNVSYIDYGTNTWTASTNTTAAIPSGVYPWSGTADVATVAANLNTASNALHLAITSEVGRATAAEDANTASIGSNDTDIAVNAGDISTNAIDISTNAIDIATVAANLNTASNALHLAITSEVGRATAAEDANTASIGSNDTDIAVNAGDISTNAIDISTNAIDIATETNRAYTVETNLQAQITDNAGYTNYAYLSWLWGDWATNYYDWDRVTNTPTTVGAGGYGVTDVYTKVESDATFAITGTVGDVVADWSGSPATQTVEYISQYSTNSVFNAVDYAQNATNDTTFPDPQSEQWQSPESATSNDDSGAGMINVPADESSSTLVLTNFGFSIPSDAVIRGVQSTTIHKQANTTGNLSNDYYQYLYVGGVFVTNDASYTFSYSTNNYLWITNTLGDTTNHWNTNLTPAIVNSSGFGIGTYIVPATATTIAAIDVVYLTVYYYRTPVTNWSAGATTNGEFDFNYEGANQFRVTSTGFNGTWGGYSQTDFSGTGVLADVYTKVESDATFATTGTVGDVVADWSGSPATQTVEYISQYSTNSVFNAVDYAQNATNDTTFPDPQSEQWQSPESATSNDDSGAGMINVPADESSSTLVLTNFGFSIPSDAVIRGVQSTTIHKQANTTGNLSNDYYQYLYVGGVFVTNDASYTFSYSTNNYLWITNTLGDTTNHWNTNLTPAIVNSSGFGIGTYIVPATATTIAAIDVVYLTVYYYRTPVTNWSAGATTNGEFDFNYEGANQFRVTSTGFNGTWGGYSQTDFSDGRDVLKKTGAIAMTGNLNFGGKSGTNLNDVTLTNEVSAKSLKLTGGNADFGTGAATNLTKVKTAAIEITGGATNGAMWICTNSATGGGKWSKLVAFRATLSHEYYLTNTVSRDIVWTGENYDYGDNFDLTVFTAPVDGLYIFEFSPYCAFVVKGHISLRLFEGSTIRQESRVYIDAGFDSTPSVPLQIYLTNGATIKAVASGSTGTTNRIQGNYSAFFGRLIRELP